MKRLILLFMGVSMVLTPALAQENFPVNGAQDKRLNIYAFTNATVVVDYQTTLTNATLLVKDGFVEAVGAGVAIPKGAIVTDLGGKFIYPSIVDPYTSYGMPEVKRGRRSFMDPPQLDSDRKEAYGWNDAIKADFDGASEFTIDAKTAEKWRKQGFGTVLAFRPDGIVRGSATLVTLSDGPVNEVIVKERVAANYAFDKGSSTQNYPNSIMGYVALLRQTYYDAQWYTSPLNKGQTNVSLEAFNALQSLPQIFETDNKLRLLLADKVGDEFGVQYIIKGSGDEYQRINEVKATKASLIIPVNYPAAYDVDDPYDALNVSLSQLKHWELAPANAAAVAKNGITFAFTASDLKDPADFLPNVRKAIKYGLSEQEALKAITYTPASLVKAVDKVGSLKKGMLANFLITSGNLFDEKTAIYENWVQGNKYEVTDMNAPDYAGNYQLSYSGSSYTLEISGKAGSQKAKVKVNDSTSVDAKTTIDGQNISLSFQPEKKKDGNIRLSGWLNGKNFKGDGQLENGDWIKWTATYQSAIEEKEKKEDGESDKAPDLGKIMYPFVAFGNEELPTAKTYLIKGATVWTSEDAGKLESTDVLVQNGKIAQVGKGLSAPSGAVTIDGTGKHLTPGIIDEHTHIALSGVNEGSEAVTSEVRQEDAIDSEDSDIYRQLAGGVVAAQLLHGSANPIGGQSALIKFRWGAAPQDLLIKGADKYIKFALGENVKQSNRPPTSNIRFPQTRMGVEQVMADAFTRAGEYDKEWKAYNGLSAKAKATAVKPRKDLELDALAEILNKQRFVTCHSYVQPEINMMMKVAERFNFRVNTFTHILEGYKVADKMAEHGVGGGTFADWWQYKYEVREAIPYNAALMTMAGVTVAINSDDAEMARRLNQEAAKSIKYTDMGELEAIKMVTINPAKLLHLDSRMGSIKAGKDADLVLWNDHPLSIYAKPEKTMVDGIVYFDIEKDAQMRAAIQDERARIIAKMKSAKASGAPTQRPSRQYKHRWDCEDEYLGDIIKASQED
ncbi:MAG: amidohydrolase family protein [Imperialibacter sp.]|uniref:amidohydrolase family protein n=1 Tax=Imperialibacter sp. TaxID=2038411 RepID=UPI0032EF37DC